MTGSRRELSLADAVGIGINGVVGSGIYLLVGPLARVGGGASVFGVLACGFLCILIALCFAELSSMYDRSGGPYVYARDAFGPVVGFGVGWLGMATGVLGLAAVASGFAGALARFLPALMPFRPGVAAALIGALGLINYLGVKKGGRTSTLLSIAKLAPLVAVALAGLRFAPRAALRWDGEGIVSAAFLSIFMMSGFEYAAVPAGEVRDARRNVPIAIVGSIAFASLLYALLQLATLGALPEAFRHEQPLPDVAARVLGGWAGPLLAATAVVSMLGFCAGVAIVAPRYFTALAEDGYLPPVLAERSRFGTPGAAILVASAFAAGLSVALGYVALVDVSNLVILSGYALTCLATLVLRARKPDIPRGIRLPLGIPVLATAAALSLLVAAKPRLAEWTFSLVLLVAGFLAWALTALSRRERAPQP